MRVFPYAGIMLILLLLCPACAPQYKEMLDTTPGMHINEVIAFWGRPNTHTAQSYTWKEHATVNHAGHWGTRRQEIVHYDNHGKRTGSSVIDVPYYNEPYTSTNWCDTTLFTDAHGVIIGYQYDGNDCSKTLPMHDQTKKP